MVDRGRHNLLGVLISAVDYEEAVARIRRYAENGEPLAVSALAVHGVMTGHTDPQQRRRLNALDMVVPDGQPVRWALNLLHGVGLQERVYGPQLMLDTCRMAETRGLGVYLYGSTGPVIERLRAGLLQRFPRLVISGAEPSRFRRLDPAERNEVISRIRGSGARITFVGLGCPRQEVWAYEYRDALSMPVLAVGAAFDFHAGTMPQAPAWMQRRGLEWLFRLGREPQRLWRRYLLLNPWYTGLVVSQFLGREFDSGPAVSPVMESFG